MKNEHLNEKPEPSPNNAEDHITAENLQFMRSAVERTYRDFDPGAASWIAWGLMCMIGYTAMHFLATETHYKLILPMWALLLPITGGINIVCDAKIRKREKKAGMIPLLSRQVGWIWTVAVLHGAVWSCLRLFGDWHIGYGFLWALVYSIALSATGIILSKEWLWGGIGVFVGMVVAFLVQDYAYIIIGFAMGLGCIIPAIIAQKNYRKQEKENA